MKLGQDRVICNNLGFVCGSGVFVCGSGNIRFMPRAQTLWLLDIICYNFLNTGTYCIAPDAASRCSGLLASCCMLAVEQEGRLPAKGDELTVQHQPRLVVPFSFWLSYAATRRERGKIAAQPDYLRDVRIILRNRKNWTSMPPSILKGKVKCTIEIHYMSKRQEFTKISSNRSHKDVVISGETDAWLRYCFSDFNGTSHLSVHAQVASTRPHDWFVLIKKQLFHQSPMRVWVEVLL